MGRNVEVWCACDLGGSNLSHVYSDEVENKIASGEGRIAQLTAAKTPLPDMIEDLYLSAYSRLPTEKERATIIAYVQAQQDERQALEDVLWTILNGKEFSFNH